MRTRRGTRLTPPVPPPSCDHCGTPGHVSAICPRTSYREDLPSLTCSACIRTVRSSFNDDPDDQQIVVHIDPCSSHSTPSIRPNRPSPPITHRRPGTTSRPLLPPPPTVPVQPPPPPLRRTRRIFSLDGTIAEYDTVVQLVNSGLNKSAALERIYVSRSQFSRKRCIAEVAKVDLPGVQHALLQLREVTLPNIYTFSTEICNRNLATLRTLYSQGVVLQLRNSYQAPPPPRRAGN